jgi:hypothetical protein
VEPPLPVDPSFGHALVVPWRKNTVLLFAAPDLQTSI